MPKCCMPLLFGGGHSLYGVLTARTQASRVHSIDRMSAMQQTFRLLDLPAELRQEVYECVQQRDEPIGPTQITSRRAQQGRIINMRLTCHQIYDKIHAAPEMFVRYNTVLFEDLGRLADLVATMPWHTLALIRNVQIEDAIKTSFFGALSPVFDPQLKILSALPNLERLAIWIGGMDDLPVPRAEVWLDTPVADGDARYN